MISLRPSHFGEYMENACTNDVPGQIIVSILKSVVGRRTSMNDELRSEDPGRLFDDAVP